MELIIGFILRLVFILGFTQKTDSSTDFIFKIILALLDTGIILAIQRITRSRRNALLYALNPVSILIIGMSRASEGIAPGITGEYGLGLVLRAFGGGHISVGYVTSLLPVCIFLYILLSRKSAVYENIQRWLFFFMVFTPVFNVLWLIWLMPFLVITRHSQRFWYMVVGTVYLMATAIQWSPLLHFMGFVMWILIIYMWRYGENHSGV